MTECLIDDTFPPIVLDNGSWDIRAGFAGDDGPLAVMPNVVGISHDEFLIGYNAQEKRELLSLHKPIEHGIIVDWESMEKIWDFTFKELQICPARHPILVAERPLTPRGNRENLAQVMFEVYNSPGFFVAFEPILPLYATGNVCGTMVDVGEGVTHVVPVSEGAVPKHAIKRIDVAGGDVTRELQALMYKNGLGFTTTAELYIVREIKESCCFVKEVPVKTKCAIDSGEKIKRYKLPDGQMIDLGSECYLCSEILFRREEGGVCLGKCIVDSIQACDAVNRRNLYGEIILSGGTTFLPGFKERLRNDVTSFMPGGSRTIRIRDKPDRKYHVWIGGSLLGSLSSFSQMWIKKSEYNEYGPSIVHRKCF